MKKVCSRCGIEKNIDYFYKNRTNPDGLNYYCKECKKQYDKEWYQNHREERIKYSQRPEVKKYRKEYQKEWRKDNPERKKESDKKWYQKHRKEIIRGSKKYRKNNPEKYREYDKEYKKNKRANDSKFRLNNNTAIAIGKSLKGSKNGRSWEKLVGYSLQDLMSRLSINFQKGMSFDNYGKWHIDHKKPQSLFRFTIPEDKPFKDCWSLANLQPLWAVDNIRKHNLF